MRVLYGYRVEGSKVVVDPLAAAVVSSVLAWEPQQRTGLGERSVRCLLPGLTREAVHKLVQRIRSHAASYLQGRAHAGLPPDSRLILSRSLHYAGIASPSPSCGVREAVRHAVPVMEDTPSPRSPDLGDVVR